MLLKCLKTGLALKPISMKRKSNALWNGHNYSYEKKEHVTAGHMQGATAPTYLGTTIQVIAIEPRCQRMGFILAAKTVTGHPPMRKNVFTRTSALYCASSA